MQPVRPGTCVLRARGPARYYGGEEQAAAELLRCLEGLGHPAARIGIADGLFGGHATPQTCQMSNEQLDHHNDDLAAHEYDVEEAKRLIQAAGAEGEEVAVVGGALGALAAQAWAGLPLIRL